MSTQEERTASVEGLAPAEDQREASLSADNQLGDILGEVFWLIGRSQELRTRPVGEIHDIVVAAIKARTFRLYRQKRAPLAFVAWGRLDEIQEARLKAAAILTAEELRSGDRAWVVLVASPFLPADVVLKELRSRDFPSEPLMTLI